MDVSDGCGGAGGRLIGCGEVGRNRQVSGNGGMGGSGRVIGAMGMSDQTSKWTIRHDAQMQRHGEEWTDTEGQNLFSWFLL